jgi:hypothetical protein
LPTSPFIGQKEQKPSHFYKELAFGTGTGACPELTEGTNLRFVLRSAAWFADWFCAKVALFEFGILNFQFKISCFLSHIRAL